MLFVGITGGVGAGKSAVLDYLSSLPRVRVMLADEIAHDLMEPGTDCWKALRAAFPDPRLYEEDGHFNRRSLAAFIFGDNEKRDHLNGIVHPAVKEYVKSEYAAEKAVGNLSLLVLEAALLIEEHYEEICDELWYIYTSEENRRRRLKSSRGYSDEKVDAIFKSQLGEDEFTAACSEIIDNNGSPEDTQKKIRELLLARKIVSSI